MSFLARLREAITEPQRIRERSQKERSTLHAGLFVVEVLFVLGLLYVVFAR